MKASVTVSRDGAVDIVNLIPTVEREFHRIGLPINAVLTQIFESRDEDGKPVYTPVTSVICHDPHMEPVLLERARRMIEAERIHG